MRDPCPQVGRPTTQVPRPSGSQRIRCVPGVAVHWIEAAFVQFLYQVVLERINNEFETAGYIQFVEDRGQVMPDRCFRNEERFCDLLILHSLADQTYHFAFPIGQRGRYRTEGKGVKHLHFSDQMTNGVTHYDPIEPDLTCMDLFNCLEQSVRALLL